MIRLRLPIEQERANRIRLSVWAYAYEILDEPVATDAAFDRLARCIHPQLVTGRPLTDWFFANHFAPHSGQWIHKHPELAGIARLHDRYYKR